MFSTVLPVVYIKETFIGLIMMGCLMMMTAVGIVSVRHLNREKHIELERLINTKNHLHVEWTQLLLEQSAFASDMRVEQIARDELGMIYPDPKKIVMIKP